MASACKPAPKTVAPPRLRTTAVPVVKVPNGAPGMGQFIIQCEAPIASAPDDPIVFPRRPGTAHNHEFYGSTTVNAFSTATSMAGQPTGCARDRTGGDPDDTASYWHPTLYVDGQRLAATKSSMYYTNRSRKHVQQAMPAGLRIIAGDSKATAPQGDNVVYWGCGSGTSISKVTSPPQCPKGTSLALHVIFPDCWNGRDLDAADHRTHMAYSARTGDGSYRCPSSHPVSVPTLIMRIIWNKATPSPKSLSLSSGSVDTMHADFFNSWNQARLEQLVDACVVGERDCDYRDVDALAIRGGA